MSNLLLAHGGGGPPSPWFATAVGSLFLLVGAGLFLRALSEHFTGRKAGQGSPLFVALFLLLFGYSFLAQGLDLPGRALAIQASIWLVVLPLLFLPWFVYHLWQLRQKQAETEAATHQAERSRSPEERVRALLQPGERLIWLGAPAPRHFRGEAIAQFIFGLIPFTFGSVFLTLLVWGTIRDGFHLAMLPGYLVGFTAASFFVLLGGALFFSPWMLMARLRHVVYAVTDRRGLVLTSRDWFWQPVPTRDLGDGVMVFAPEQLRGGVRKRRGISRVDLVFVSERRGSGKGRQTVHYGFLGLERPEDALAEIAAAFPAAVAG